MSRLASCDLCYYRYALVLTRLHLGHALSVTVYITWFLVTLLFFYPQILCCHALSLSVSCDLMCHVSSRHVLVCTRFHYNNALMSRSLLCICILVTLVIAIFYLCHGPYNVTVVHHYVLVSTRCHLPHVTWPVFLYVTVRFTSLLCHALVITWRHYTLASLSFPSLTIFLVTVTLLLSRDVTTL